MLQGSFEGRGWEFFKRGWWLWPLAILSLCVFPLAPFIYGAFKAVQWRWWLSGVRFGGVRLESTLRRGALLGLYWKVIGWALLLMVAFVAYLALCASLLASMNGTSLGQFLSQFVMSRAPATTAPMLVLAGVGYLALVLASNVVMRIYLLRDLWARVVSSTSIHGIEAAENVSARGELANALGEGFADGLEVAGF